MLTFKTGIPGGTGLRDIVLGGDQRRFIYGLYFYGGDPAPPPLMGRSPQFSANVRCSQSTGWTKMPLGMAVGLGPGDFLFDEDPATPIKRAHPPHQIFGHACLFRPNAWMDQDATWYGGKRRLRRRCVRWGHSFP